MSDTKKNTTVDTKINLTKANGKDYHCKPDGKNTAQNIEKFVNEFYSKYGRVMTKLAYE